MSCNYKPLQASRLYSRSYKIVANSQASPNIHHKRRQLTTCLGHTLTMHLLNWMTFTRKWAPSTGFFHMCISLRLVELKMLVLDVIRGWTAGSLDICQRGSCLIWLCSCSGNVTSTILVEPVWSVLFFGVLREGRRKDLFTISLYCSRFNWCVEEFSPVRRIQEDWISSCYDTCFFV